MTIQSERIDRTTLALFVAGRLDTATAPQLERKIKQVGNEITELILDFSRLVYISSMGLRVLLQTQKLMHVNERKLVIRHMNDTVREVFEMTGFVNLMVQEEKFVVIRKEEEGLIRLNLIGQMDTVNIPPLAKELSVIRAANKVDEERTTFVVLDVGELTSITPAAGRLLHEAVAQTNWDKRDLSIRNARGEVLAALKGSGLEKNIETGNA